MTFRNPTDPYSSFKLDKPNKPLHCLGQPGCALWRCGNISLVFMFGGYGLEADKPNARVIIINPSAREWWYEEGLDRGGPTPCTAPSLVTIDNRIFIFGGYQSYDIDPQACHSYNILRWEPPSAAPRSRWHWQSCNTPYKLPMPANAVVGQAVSVYGSKFFFLVPGKTNDQDKNNRVSMHYIKIPGYYLKANECFGFVVCSTFTLQTKTCFTFVLLMKPFELYRCREKALKTLAGMWFMISSRPWPILHHRPPTPLLPQPPLSLHQKSGVAPLKSANIIVWDSLTSFSTTASTFSRSTVYHCMCLDCSTRDSTRIPRSRTDRALNGQVCSRHLANRFWPCRWMWAAKLHAKNLLAGWRFSGLYSC